MAYDTKPTAENVNAFAKRMEREWHPGQKKMDDLVYNLYLKMDALDVSEPERDAERVEVKPLRTGFLGISADGDAAALAGVLALTVTPHKNDPKVIEQANSVLEPWLNGVLDQSQVGDVILPQIRDMVLFSRGWSQFIVLPRLWAESKFRDLLEEYVTLTERRVKLEGKKDKDLEAEIIEVKDQIAAYKRDNFPLRMRYCSARVVWPQLSGERRLPEVVELREATKGQLKDEFGADAIPGPQKELGDATKIPVYTYCNWFWTATVIGDQADPQLVHKWDHNAGMSPYLLMEVNVQPDNERNIRWKPRAFDFADSISTEDEIRSNLRHIHRREAETPLVVTLDPQARGMDDPKIAGKLNAIEIRAEDGTIRLLKDEKIEEGPIIGISSQSMELLNSTHEYNTQYVLRPILMGATMSGDSAVKVEIAKNQAKEHLNPYRKAIRGALKDMGKLAFRYVPRINEDFPGIPDPIVVVDEKLGQIAVKPKDVEGWESYIGVRLGEPGPVSENAQMNLAVSAQNLPIHPAVILAKWLGFEDAEAQVERWEQWQIEKSLMQVITQMVTQQAGVLAQETTAATVPGMASQIQNLPPEMLMALAQNGIPEAQEALGRMQQVAPNVVRTGTSQDMSQTAAQQVGTMGPEQFSG